MPSGVPFGAVEFHRESFQESFQCGTSLCALQRDKDTASVSPGKFGILNYCAQQYASSMSVLQVETRVLESDHRGFSQPD